MKQITSLYEQLRDEQLAYIADQLAEQAYAVTDGWLIADELAAIRQEADRRFERGDFQAAGIGQSDQYHLNKKVRGDYIHWVDDQQPAPALQPFFDRLNDMVTYLNRHLFLGLKELEMHLAIYPVGTFYKRHLDVFQTDGSRKLSVVFYLNDDWAPDDHGELRLYLPQDDGTETHLDVLPLGGRLVVFLSDVLEHEVRPATRERYSLTGWIKDRRRLV